MFHFGIKVAPGKENSWKENIIVSVHGTLKLEIRNLAFMLLYC
jgi:hypothetical protein